MLHTVLRNVRETTEGRKLGGNASLKQIGGERQVPAPTTTMHHGTYHTLAAAD